MTAVAVAFNPRCGAIATSFRREFSDLLVFERAGVVHPDGRRALNELVQLSQPESLIEFGLNVERYVEAFGLFLFSLTGERGAEPVTIREKVYEAIPLSLWRGLSQSALSLLNASLARNESGGASDTVVVGPHGTTTEVEGSLGVLQFAVVNEWIRLSAGAVEFELREKRATCVLQADALEGAIAHQLLVAAIDIERVTSCSVCRAPFLAQRRPKEGARGSYCDRHRASSSYHMARITRSAE